MSITLPPLPRPGPLGLIQYAGSDMQEYAATASAAKDAEIAQLRADLIKSLADNKGLRAEVAGLREDAERYRWLRDKLDVNDRATWSIFMAEGVEQWDAAIDAALAARKGEA